MIAWPSPSWHQSASCRSANAELFFPVTKAAPGIPDAKRICRACPVKDDCLRWAMQHQESFGIWGGMLPHERAEMRRAG